MTFLNAGYAPWLLAIGLPVAIHLLTRQAIRVFSLPTFRFLQASVARQSRLFRVRHLLLLLLRTLLVALLVLVFLKPTRSGPLGAIGGGKRTVVIVLDVSLSMAYNASGVTSFEKARAQALNLLDGLGTSDRADVILARAAPAAILPQASSDIGTLRHTVRTATPTAEKCDSAAAVALAAETLGTAGAGPSELYLISDFQRTSWADVKLDALPPAARVVFVGTEDGERDNIAVTSIHLRPPTPRAGDAITALVEVWNGTGQPRALPVTFRAGAQAAQAVTVLVPPFATGTAAFPITFAQPGRYACSASLPDDALPADNTRWFVADLQHGLTVLLLTDENADRSPSGAYFISRALNPTPGQPGGVRVIAKHAADLTAADLRLADAVIVADVVTLPADRLPAIYRYVRDGGALMAFVYGARVRPQIEALNRLAGNGEGLAFLPTEPIDVRAKGKGYVTLAEARYESRFLRVFRDPVAADLGKIRFYRFFLTTEADSRAEVLLKYEDGTPAAARRSLGAGNVLLLNFSPAPGDSDLARQEVFPPLLHELLKGLAGGTSAHRDAVPGGTASITIAPPKGRVTATGPDGRSRPVTVDREGGGVVLEHADQPGLYRIAEDGREAGLIAVNIDPDESDLRTIDPRELQSRRDRRPAYLVGTSARSTPLDGLTRQRPLWPIVLLAALLTLGLEHLVASMGAEHRSYKGAHEKTHRNAG